MIADFMTMDRERPEWSPVSIPDATMTIGNLAARTAGMAVRALLREAEAGPKPGLVDRFGPGVHTDMDISHFRLSAAVLGPYFKAITLESALATVKTGKFIHPCRIDGRPGDRISDQTDDTFDSPVALAHRLRELGLQAESAMLTATGGVNTHKGAIWTLGLLCAAVGSLAGGGYGKPGGITQTTGQESRDAPAGIRAFLYGLPDTETGLKQARAVCSQAASLAKAILACQLTPATNPAVAGSASNAVTPCMASERHSGLTNGLVARQVYGLRSARDEALDGFPSIQTLALPLARTFRTSTLHEDEKVISILLAVMGKADDTCIVARGGLPALRMAQSAARQVLDAGGPTTGAGGILYRKLVADFKHQGLSPGGSADLCAATLFLSEIEVGLASCLADDHKPGARPAN